MNNEIKRINYPNARKALHGMDECAVAQNYLKINKIKKMNYHFLSFQQKCMIEKKNYELFTHAMKQTWSFRIKHSLDNKEKSLHC